MDGVETHAMGKPERGVGDDVDGPLVAGSEAPVRRGRLGSKVLCLYGWMVFVSCK